MSERKKIAVLLWLFFLCLYLLTAKGFIKHFDNETVYQVTRSIVEQGRVSVEKEFAGGIVGTRGPDGLLYSKFEIGQSLMAIPLYLLGKAFTGVIPGLPQTLFTRFTCSFLDVFVTATTCVVIYLFCLDLGYGRRTSVVLAFLYGAGTIAWPYSKTLFRGPVISLFILSGAFYAYHYRLDGRLSSLLACSSCLAIAVLVRLDAMLAVAVIGVYIALTSPRDRGAGREPFILLAPIAIALAANLTYNWARYGSMWITGYEGQGIDTGFSTPFAEGLYGLLLSSGKSIFIYSPVLVLFLPSIFFFFTARRKEALLFIAVIFIYTCFYAKWWCWHGGWCWGPRFMLQVIPFAVIPIGSLLERRTGALVVSVVVAIAVVSFGVQLLAVSVSEMRFIQATLFSWEVDDELFQPGRRVCPDEINFEPAFFPLRAQWRSLLNSSWGKLDYDLRDSSVLEETAFRRQLERGPDMWWAYLYRLGLPPCLLMAAIPLVVVCALSLFYILRCLR